MARPPRRLHSGQKHLSEQLSKAKGFWSVISRDQMCSLQRTFQDIQPKFYLQLPVVFKYSCNSRGSSSVFDSGFPPRVSNHRLGHPRTDATLIHLSCFPVFMDIGLGFSLLFAQFFDLACHFNSTLVSVKMGHLSNHPRWEIER